MEGTISDWKTDDISKVETASETHLEDDKGSGHAVIIRVFEFAANPEVFKRHKPTRQELFNHHSKGIEAMLWADGLTVVPDVNPRVTVNKKKTKYHIFVGAMPSKGHLLNVAPQTLTEVLT
jgi:hypothetical protein